MTCRCHSNYTWSTSHAHTFIHKITYIIYFAAGSYIWQNLWFTNVGWCHYASRAWQLYTWYAYTLLCTYVCMITGTYTCTDSWQTDMHVHVHTHVMWLVAIWDYSIHVFCTRPGIPRTNDNKSSCHNNHGSIRNYTTI